jgi:hypothetical protein
MDLRLNGAEERRAKGCGRAETIAESATYALDLNARRVAAHVASFVLYNHWKKDRHFPGRATRRDGRSQWFDLVPGLGCYLAAQLCYSRIQQDRVPGGRRGVTSDGRLCSERALVREVS